MIVIFDLDGTLLNTIDDLGYACNYALQQASYPVHSISAYPAMVGNGINMLIRRALPEEVRTDETVLSLRQNFVAYYNQHNCDYTRPYAGIPELLRTLRSEGHTLAVASNKYQEATEKIICRFFPKTFACVLGERAGIPRKPDPAIIRDILSHPAMRDSSENPTPATPIWYVGDSLVDRDTATNAGLRFVACSWGFVARSTLQDAGIPNIADHPREILRFVAQGE